MFVCVVGPVGSVFGNTYFEGRRIGYGSLIGAGGRASERADPPPGRYVCVLMPVRAQGCLSPLPMTVPLYLSWPSTPVYLRSLFPFHHPRTRAGCLESLRPVSPCTYIGRLPLLRRRPRVCFHPPRKFVLPLFTVYFRCFLASTPQFYRLPPPPHACRLPGVVAACAR